MTKPLAWGPSMWKTIHYIALAYPEKPTQEEKQDYKNFFLNLYKVIPCYGCAVNYQKNMEILPIDNHLDNNLTLFKWTFLMHNMVNVETGKPEIAFDDAIDIYLGNVSSKNQAFWGMNLGLLVAFVVVVAVVVWRKKCGK